MPELSLLHLPAAYLRTVQTILHQVVPHATVWAYGSRVHGNHHDASDLDLVLRNPGGNSCPFDNADQLREAFSDSNLPILIQVMDWAHIPDSFRPEIEAGYVVVQAGSVQ